MFTAQSLIELPPEKKSSRLIPLVVYQIGELLIPGIRMGGLNELMFSLYRNVGNLAAGIAVLYYLLESEFFIRYS